MPKTERVLRSYSKVLTFLGVLVSCFIFQSNLSAQCGTMVCNNVLQISMDENCEIFFNPDLLLEGDHTIQGTSFTLTIADLGIVNQALDLTETIPIGTYQYKVTNDCGNSCWGSFFAEDNIGPRLIGGATCPQTDPCRFACNEITTVLNDATFTTHLNPDFTMHCAGNLEVKFEDKLIKATASCGIDTIKREWYAFVNKHGSSDKTIITTQWFVFDPVDMADVWMPTESISVPCHISEHPDSIAAYLDNPLTCENEGIPFAYPHIEGTPMICDECAPIEIHFKKLKELKEDVPLLVEVPGGEDQWVLIDQWIKETDSRLVCGCEEWNQLESEVKDVYAAVGDIVDITSGFPGVLDADGKCTSWPTTSQWATWTGTGSGTGAWTGSGTGAWTGAPTTSPNHIPLYGNDHICNLLTNKEDLIIPICGHGDYVSSYKVVRTWTVYDWCTATTKKSVQIIKVEDLEGPSFTVQDSLLLSTDPWLCGINLEVPPPSDVNDKCSPDHISYTVHIEGLPGLHITGNSSTGYTILDIPKGDQKLIYTVSDNCGNSTTDTTLLWIKDNIPPVAIAKENIVVSLTSSGNGAGQAKVFYNSIDNGSYDICSPKVKIEIRRETDLCGIVGNDTYTSGSNRGDINYGDASGLVDPDGGQYVKFCCEDLTEGTFGIHKVWMRVWDDANMDGVIGNAGDNFNEVWANVRVEDKLNVILTCPQDITVSCYIGLDSLSVLGTPDAQGACAVNLVYEDELPSTHCPTGLVLRKWYVDKDLDGKFDTGEKLCKQTINVTDPRPMFCSDIIFPQDTIVDCASAEMDAEPIWTGDHCGLFGFSEKVDIFDLQDEYCYKIVKQFTVIDWCQYNPNSGSNTGICYATQKITVVDNAAPTFASCEDKIVESADAGCVVENLSISQTALDEGACIDKKLIWTICLDLGSNRSCDYTYTAITQSGEELAVDLVDDNGAALAMIAGTHSVTWTVTDACDNSSSCTTKLIVADTKAPTPICIEALSTAVMSNNGSVEIWATDFDPNKKSFDNCDKSLTYSFSGEEIISNLMISCRPSDADSLIGSIENGLFIENGQSQTFELPMWVWDDGYDVNCDGRITSDERNKDWCMVMLRVDDNVNACADIETNNAAMIAGAIQTDQGEMVESVEVVITSTHPEHPSMAVTQNNGSYAFMDNPMALDYEISAARDDNHMNGVSTLDLVLIQKHILGLSILDSPYKVIASDINNDGNISATDLVELRKLILGIYAELPNNSSWRFVDGVQEFQNPLSPFPFLEDIEIYNLSDDMLSQDFVGIKVGDVNGNVTANSLVASEVRAVSKLVLTTDQQSVTKGDRVDIDFRSEDFESVYGMQFTMAHAGLRLVEVVAGAVDLGEENIGVIKEDALLSLSWGNVESVSSDEVLFTMTFEANRSLELSNTINISSQVTHAEAYTTDSYVLNDVTLQFNNSAEEENFILYQNEPNPFSNKTEIGFSLPAASSVTLKVFDVTGKLVLLRKGSYPKGLSIIELNSNDLSSTGILYYQLDAGKYNATKKMVMIN